MKKDLGEFSDAYYGLNKYYEMFSVAEDYPNYIEKELEKIVQNKVVLDAGCGTGKYLKKFENIAKKLYGIDAANDQLKIAKNKVSEKVILECADLETLDIPDNTFDVIYSTWVLGTITSDKKRERVLTELKRVLKPNGKLVLVENNIGGYFEEIRDRYPNIERTKNYNDWLSNHNFKVLKEIDTYFKFTNEEEAFKCFDNVYGNKIAKKTRARIEHKVIILYQ